MKLQIQIYDIIQIMTGLSETTVNKIDDYQGLLIVDYVKDNKLNILKKIEKAKNSYSDEIKLNFTRATGAALYHWLIHYKYKNEDQSNRFAFIAMEIHKQLVNSISADFFEQVMLPTDEIKKLPK